MTLKLIFFPPLLSLRILASSTNVEGNLTRRPTSQTARPGVVQTKLGHIFTTTLELSQVLSSSFPGELDWSKFRANPHQIQAKLRVDG